MKHFVHTAQLIFAAMREQTRAEKAFLGNFWLGIGSRLIYNIMFLIFIDVLFKRTGAIAGHSHNDFLFMYFISQVGFYVTYGCLFKAVQQLLLTVRDGNLDLLLLKPVPHRSFLYIQGQQPIDLLLTLVTTLSLVASQIDWSALTITPVAFLLGTIIWVCGVIICNTLLFALILPAFKTGEATDTLNVFYSITSLTTLPYGKLPFIMKALSLCVLPHLIIAGASAEVMMQKGNMLGIIVPIIIATLVSLCIYQLSWRYALRNYTSASS